MQAIGKVNKGIKVSLANEPQMFMAYNNGISTIAESIAVDEGRSSGDIVNITEITGWQIVNGGQTTASIYNAYKAKLPLEQVNVQIKLSVIKQKIEQKRLYTTSLSMQTVRIRLICLTLMLMMHIM